MSEEKKVPAQAQQQQIDVSKLSSVQLKAICFDMELKLKQDQQKVQQVYQLIADKLKEEQEHAIAQQKAIADAKVKAEALEKDKKPVVKKVTKAKVKKK